MNFKKVLLKLTGIRIIASFIGLLYSVLLVRVFGATADVDAYYIAISAVFLVISLAQGGQISEVFLPVYLDVKHQYGDKASYKLFSALINRILVFTSVILIFLYFLAPFIIDIIGAGLNDNSKLLSIDLFRISLLLFVFSIIASFVNTVLNAERIYGRAEFTALINGVISISLLLFFKDSIGVYILVYALLIGKILEFFVGLIFLRNKGFTYFFIWKAENADFVAFFKILGSTSTYVGATQLFNVVMTSMASYLPEGSVALYNYTAQLSTKATRIFIGPISNVFFSEFKHYVNKKKYDLEAYLMTPLLGIYCVTFLMAVSIYLLGSDILKLLWSDKNLAQEEFGIAYVMLTLNFVGTIFTSLAMIFRKSSIVMGKAKILYNSWTIMQLICALYSYIVIKYIGIYGLASISIFNMIILSAVSYTIANRSSIPGNKIFKTIFLKENLLYFSILLIVITIVIKLLINDFLLLKIGIYGGLTVLLILLFYRSKIEEFKHKLLNNRTVVKNLKKSN